MRSIQEVQCLPTVDIYTEEVEGVFASQLLGTDERVVSFSGKPNRGKASRVPSIESEIPHIGFAREWYVAVGKTPAHVGFPDASDIVLGESNIPDRAPPLC